MIHNNASSSEKVTIYQWKQFQINFTVEFDVRGQQVMGFLTGESIMD